MYGTNKDKRMLRCSECKIKLSENNGTVYYRSHIPADNEKWTLVYQKEKHIVNTRKIHLYLP